MPCGPGFTLALLELWICLQAAGASSPCNIIGETARCGVRNLSEVPPLPRHVTAVDLSLNNIQEIHPGSFRGSGDIRVLILDQQNRRLSLRDGAFSRLPGLTEVYLRYNRFLLLEAGAFRGSLALRTLDLTGCSLNESILSGGALRPLVSLEELILRENHIGRIRPAQFFVNVSGLHTLDVSRNPIGSVCEGDLRGAFRGKHFRLLGLSDVKLVDMDPRWPGWDGCGNPLRNVTVDLLDLSWNGFSVDIAVRFFGAIRGTKIDALDLSSSSSMGRGVWFNNLKDPDRDTFGDLSESGVKVLDLSHGRIFTLMDSVFGRLLDLELLSLASNSINHIVPGAFTALGRLQLLNLSDNLMDKVGPETFRGLPGLVVLDLSRNNIRTLSSSSFTGLLSLALLNLSENSVKHANQLAALPGLRVLDLKGNRMENLHGFAEAAGGALLLDVRDNRLSSAASFRDMLAEFPDIRMIELGENFLLWCSGGQNRSVSRQNPLEVLDAHATGLPNLWAQGECLDIFAALPRLHTLILHSNYMQVLHKDVFRGLTSLRTLDLSYNLLTFLPAGVLPGTLRVLDLRQNSLGSVDPAALGGLDTVLLAGNRFVCDCELREFRAWLNETRAQTDAWAAPPTCALPEAQRGRPLLAAELRCPEDAGEDAAAAEGLRFALFVCCTLATSLAGAGGVVHARGRGRCLMLFRRAIARVTGGARGEPGGDGYAYDVFLCFSLRDVRWVTEALLGRLDSQLSGEGALRCCFEARDFLPGEDHLTNMHNAISRSRKTLCVLSRHFLEDGWCLEALGMAQSRMLEEVRELLVVLLVDRIPPYRLMRHEQVRTYARTRRYLRWPDDEQDLEWFYERLHRSLAKGGKVREVVEVGAGRGPDHGATGEEEMTAV